MTLCKESPFTVCGTGFLQKKNQTHTVMEIDTKTLLYGGVDSEQEVIKINKTIV